MACGKHPTLDPDGKPLEKGSVFFPMKGKPLHQGFKGVVWSIIGDHEYFSNTLGLPHWSSHYPCWECDAENFTPCTFEKGYKEICLEKQLHGQGRSPPHIVLQGPIWTFDGGDHALPVLL